MKDLYSWVHSPEDLRVKIVPVPLEDRSARPQLLENTLAKIVNQTVECAIFIHKFTGHGFTGK
jgi:hypothetical protein